MPELSERAYIGAIRCECGGEMVPVTGDSQVSAGEHCHTVECLSCGEVGGYNETTLEVFGATDAVELVGEG